MLKKIVKSNKYLIVSSVCNSLLTISHAKSYFTDLASF